MQVETLSDVLHWTVAFHQHLSKCLAHCATKNQNERARMQLDYLADHEKKLAHLVARFKETSDSKALETWCYEYVNKHPIVKHEFCDAPFANINAEQAMEIIVDQHQQVIALYKNLAERAAIPSAKELLKELESMQEHEIMRAVQTANRFNDM